MALSILSRTDLSVKEPSFIVSGASPETSARSRTFDFLDTTAEPLKGYTGVPCKSQVALSHCKNLAQVLLWTMALAYLASVTKANLQQVIHAIGHDLALCSCNHPKNDNGSTALLP